MTIYTIHIERAEGEEDWRIDHLGDQYFELSRGIAKGEGSWKEVGVYESIGLALRHVVTGKKQ